MLTFGAQVPPVQGVIDRRILANWRIESAELTDVLPDPFRPLTVEGYGVGGVCLIRLTDARPNCLPAALGFESENAAHRIAVEWDEDGETKQGVYVPRRDTSSWAQATFGEEVFAGRYSHAEFSVEETGGRYAVQMDNDEDDARMRVVASRIESFPDDSVFDSLDDASTFFQNGSVGYSPGEESYEGVELQTKDWAVEPLDVETVESSYFGDESRFSPEAVEFDCALLMEDIDHEWVPTESLCAPEEGA